MSGSVLAFVAKMGFVQKFSRTKREQYEGLISEQSVFLNVLWNLLLVAL